MCERGVSLVPDRRADVIVVGAGMAGLTSAAYLAKQGYRVMLFEKHSRVGGLVGTFFHNGYGFDYGIRALENSGIILPMLKELGIPLEYEKSVISIGIEDSMIRYDRKESLYAYQKMLSEKFSDNREEIDRIIQEIEKVITYMDIIYGIDNPLFVDYRNDRRYLVKTLLPWLLKYTINIRKALKLNLPVVSYLKKFTRNESLIDMITQHFFKETPTFFALSYFGLYLDYIYPKGGTGVLSEKMARFFVEKGGEIHTDCEVIAIDPIKRYIRTKSGSTHSYRFLIWAADMRALYANLDLAGFNNEKALRKIQEQKQLTEGGRGSDSILSLYLETDLDKSYFEKTLTAHGFYTPRKTGLTNSIKKSWTQALSLSNTHKEKRSAIESWIKNYLWSTTYELSIPVLSDPSLAPEGKTGLIVSTLIDYRLVKTVAEQNGYEEFKSLCQREMVAILDRTLFPGLESKTKYEFCSTPLSIERITGNTEGAITGWSFCSPKIPAVTGFKQITDAVKTPIPDVFQAGHWTFSPSGLPVSILTGKVAADAVKSRLKKQRFND
jgi:phytoene dehydrogenase-like protein